jgi:hypothetical protein
MLVRRVRLDAFDRDRGKEAGELLGWASYNLNLVAEGQLSEQWVQMRNVFAGELRIWVLVLSGTDGNVKVCSPSHMCCHVSWALGIMSFDPKNGHRRANCRAADGACAGSA